MSASDRASPPDPASAAQFNMSNHTSPESTASMPGFGNRWEYVHERVQETINHPTHVADPSIESKASDLRSAEVSVPTTAVRPDGVQPASHRGSLTTGIAASATTAPGFRAKFQKIVTCVAFSIKFAKTKQKKIFSGAGG